MASAPKSIWHVDSSSSVTDRFPVFLQTYAFQILILIFSIKWMNQVPVGHIFIPIAVGFYKSTKGVVKEGSLERAVRRQK